MKSFLNYKAPKRCVRSKPKLYHEITNIATLFPPYSTTFSHTLLKQKVNGLHHQTHCHPLLVEEKRNYKVCNLLSKSKGNQINSAIEFYQVGFNAWKQISRAGRMYYAQNRQDKHCKRIEVVSKKNHMGFCGVILDLAFLTDKKIYRKGRSRNQ